MLYYFLYPLAKYLSVLNIFKYITFRGGMAFLTSFALVMLLWPAVSTFLKKLNAVENIDMYGHKQLEQLFAVKKGTPTLGGILILCAGVSSILLWIRWDNLLVWSVLFTMIALGGLGIIDDLLKIRHGKGFSRREKFTWQMVIGILFGLFLMFSNSVPKTWDFPFLKRIVLDLGVFYMFWTALVIAATSNAVNFTDGLDGLAIGALIINFLLFAFLSYLAGNIKYSHYLFIPYIKGAGELVIICLALAGAGMGFLWYNAYPADIFMGNVGALALSGAIGAVAVIVKQEFLLIISGGLFVIEALSVIIQIGSVRLRRKKVFLAAPLHHHFQILGWKEPKIIVRLWMVSLLCAVAAVMALKLR